MRSGRWSRMPERGGHFIEVVLRPTVTLAAGSDVALAESLHERAHHLCFVANSVNFPVRCERDRRRLALPTFRRSTIKGGHGPPFQRPSPRDRPADSRSRLCRHHDRDVGARHRREHRGVQPGQGDAAEPAALRRRRSADGDLGIRIARRRRTCRCARSTPIRASRRASSTSPATRNTTRASPAARNRS